MKVTVVTPPIDRGVLVRLPPRTEPSADAARSCATYLRRPAAPTARPSRTIRSLRSPALCRAAGPVPYSRCRALPRSIDLQHVLVRVRTSATALVLVSVAHSSCCAVGLGAAGAGAGLAISRARRSAGLQPHSAAIQPYLVDYPIAHSRSPPLVRTGSGPPPLRCCAGQRAAAGDGGGWRVRRGEKQR